MPSLIVTKTDLALLNLLADHPALRRRLDRVAVVPPRAVPSDVVTTSALGIERVVTQPERAGATRAQTS